MKEVKISDKDMIEILNKEHHIEFCPICENCSHEVIDFAMHHFDHVDICLQRLGKDEVMYHLGIMVGNDCEED